MLYEPETIFRTDCFFTGQSTAHDPVFRQYVAKLPCRVLEGFDSLDIAQLLRHYPATAQYRAAAVRGHVFPATQRQVEVRPVPQEFPASEMVVGCSIKETSAASFVEIHLVVCKEILLVHYAVIRQAFHCTHPRGMQVVEVLPSQRENFGKLQLEQHCSIS